MCYTHFELSEEIKEHFLDNGKSKDLNINELSKLVYLYRAIYKSLRLFPPVPFNLKCSVQSDILPSVIGQKRIDPL